MAKLKAASIINNIEVARELLGEPKLEELLAHVPPPTQALFARRLLALEWIDADEWLPFQDVILERHFQHDEEAFRAYIRKVCERDFSTFYKTIIRLLISPESLLERTAKLWSTYSEDGVLQSLRHPARVGRRSVTVRLSQFHTAHSVFGILLHAFVEQLLRLAGARNVEVSRTLNRIHDGVLETELAARYG